MDSRLQRILYVASTLGLCRPDDIDLIRGATSTAKQLAFMSHLLDIVSIMDSAANSDLLDNNSNNQILSGGAARSLGEQFSCDIRFLNMLDMQPSVERSHLKLIPPYIMKQVNCEGKEQKTTNPPPHMSSLKEIASKCKEDLAKLSIHLQKIKDSYKTHTGCGQPNSDTSMKLALSELSQLMAGFCCCFENEIELWCKPSSTQHSNQLGVTFSRIHTLLQPFIKLLQSLANRQSSDSNLYATLTQQKSIDNVAGSDSMGCSIESLQQYMSVLSETIQLSTL